MNCRLCGSKNIRYLLCTKNTHGRYMLNKKAKYKIFRCLDCQCVFIGNIIVDERYYKKNYDLGYYVTNKQGNLSTLISDLLMRFSASYKEKVILKFSKNDGEKISILDVGCGEGSFLSNLNKNLFEANGLEINKEGADICQKKNLKVYRQNLQNTDFKEKKFDVITLWHVLEHLDDPISTLKKASDILNKNGILLLSTPNTDSLGFRYGKNNWFHMDSPRHLVLYNEKSIRKLTELADFDIIKIKSEYFEYPLDLFWSLKKYYANYLSLPLYPIIKILKPETLIIVCKKSTNKKS